MKLFPSTVEKINSLSQAATPERKRQIAERLLKSAAQHRKEIAELRSPEKALLLAQEDAIEKAARAALAD